MINVLFFILANSIASSMPSEMFWGRNSLEPETKIRLILTGAYSLNHCNFGENMVSNKSPMNITEGYPLPNPHKNTLWITSKTM